MITKITNKVFNYLFQADIFSGMDKSEIDWIKYGIEITVSSTIGVLLILMLSLVFNSIISGIVFLLVFIPVRQFVGGYHASTYFRCNATFLSSFLCVLVLERNVFPSTSLLSILLFFEVLISLIMAPVKNKHKPIGSHKRFLFFKIVGSIGVLLYGITGIFLLHNNIRFGYTITYTISLITVLVIIGYFKGRRTANEEPEKNR